MTLASLFAQLLNGLVDASSMFLIAVGLSLIFGVTRVVNFAHGSLFMLGIYTAYTLARVLGSSLSGFALSVLAAALAVGLLGAAIEIVVLRRIYRAPELYQLLATFALVLIIKDVALATFGPDDLFTPRVEHLGGAVELFGRRIPVYDFVVIACGPLVLGALWTALHRSHWGRLIRAATEDREMLGALGTNQAWLFTGAFALGSFLAGLAGGLQGPRMAASLGLDLETISTAFVVVVVGGMGSIPGAFVAALLIGVTKALCVALGDVSIAGAVFSLPRLTLVVEFLVMAVVLVVRPQGLFGKVQSAPRANGARAALLMLPGRRARAGMLALLVVLALVPLVAYRFPYLTVIMVEILIAVLFAASLQFLVGPAGMHSFGHAAYFGLGAYGAALLFKAASLPMELALACAPLVAGLGALLFGWFSVRLSGIYLAMLTLAFAQITWSVAYQWDGLTGGSNGIVGIWPARWLAGPIAYYYLTLALTVGGVYLLRRILFAPFGYALRAARDSPLRAAAIGMDARTLRWAGFVVAGLFCGLAGALYAFSKGSISPDVLYVNRSIDGLVMVLLGGVEALAGPWLGASLFTWLADIVARETDYWRAWLGLSVLVLVIALPRGLAGIAPRLEQLWRWRARQRGAASGGSEALDAARAAASGAPR